MVSLIGKLESAWGTLINLTSKVGTSNQVLTGGISRLTRTASSSCSPLALGRILGETPRVTVEPAPWRGQSPTPSVALEASRSAAS